MTAWIQSFAAFIVVFLTGWTLRSSNKAPEVRHSCGVAAKA
jgi:hypothetical protein